MKKETIGKLQLWIGIVLLIAGIFGLIYSYSIIRNSATNIPTGSGDQIEKIGNIILTGQSISTRTLIRAITGENSIITLFISLLFITQGLANKAKN